MAALGKPLGPCICAHLVGLARRVARLQSLHASSGPNAPRTPCPADCRHVASTYPKSWPMAKDELC